jgi:hypothetical protein
MEDIFAEWKLRKFIIAESYMFDDPNSTTVILTDISFWAQNIDELIKWCSTNGGTLSGMTVKFQSEAVLTLFLLRWS